jgi:hypothetical protein
MESTHDDFTGFDRLKGIADGKTRLKGKPVNFDHGMNSSEIVICTRDTRISPEKSGHAISFIENFQLGTSGVILTIS